MARQDGKRNFALRDSNGTETSTFSGRVPRQAALKAARRLESASTEDAASKTELRLREKGTDRIHIYEGWAWEEEVGEDSPDWLSGAVTKANVSKKRVEHAE